MPTLYPDNLSPAQLDVIHELYKNPLLNNDYVCAKAHCVQDSLYKAIRKVIEANTTNSNYVASRVTVFTELGYIKPHPLVSEYEPLNRIATALQQPYLMFANHHVLGKVIGNSPSYVNTLIRRLYAYHGLEIDYNDDTSTQYRRLQFYAHVGWFNTERLYNDAVQYYPQETMNA